MVQSTVWRVRPSLLAGLLGCAAMGALTACGGGGGRVITTPTPAPPPAPTPTPTPAPTPAPTSTFNTTEYRRSSGAPQHGAITAWEAGHTGTGQAIAIVDTGIDTTSPEFAGRILAASRDVTTGGRSIHAEDDHGTNVALVAAAARDNRGILGIAFNAPLLVLRADTPGSCADTGANTNEASCSFSDSSIARGVDAAVAGGARVINISLGSANAVTAGVRDAVARASAAGVVIVVAAGNGGTGNRAGTDPNQPNVFASSIRAAGGGNVIIVGSVDAGNQISAFSQRAGNEAAWYLTARGERICCVYENGEIYVGQDANGSFNLLFSGTSFATPQVAGAVALLAQAFPNLTGQQIVRILLDSARDAGDPGVDAIYGTGVLDIAAALRPRGAMTMAGSTSLVRIGADTAVGSGAMGDAFTGAAAIGGVALDSYERAYGVDFASGLRGAAPRGRLHGALATGLNSAAGSAGGVAMAFTVADRTMGAGVDASGPLHLTPGEAQGARVLAARAAARIAPGTQIAFATREGAHGLTAQLRGTRQPAFYIAGEAASDSGFQRQSEIAAVLRREIGATGVSVSAESGALWLGNRRLAAEVLTGSPRERFPLRSFGVALDRTFRGVEATFGASWLDEDATVLGAFLSPTFGARGADTLFLDAAGAVEMAPGWRLAAGWRQGWTRARSGGVIAGGAPFVSNGWHIDLSARDALLAGDTLALRLSQPLRVADGGIALLLPVGYDYATRAAEYGMRFLSFAPTGREIDAELAWRGLLWGGEAGASLFYRIDPGHYAQMPADQGVAASWSRRF